MSENSSAQRAQPSTRYLPASARATRESIHQCRRPRVNKKRVPTFRVWENEHRQDVIEAVRKADANSSVQMVHNQDRKLVHVVAGDILALLVAEPFRRPAHDRMRKVDVRPVPSA